MPSLPSELQSVRLRPSTYLFPVNLDTLGAYMYGFYAGRGEPEVMAEFQQFLSERLGRYRNIVWPQALQRMRASGEGRPVPDEGSETEPGPIEEAFSLLELFLLDRDCDS